MARIARIGAGIGLILLGLILLVLPGPGLLTIAGGLALLATEFTWAANILDWMKQRYRAYFTKEGRSADTPLSDDLDPTPGATLGTEPPSDYEGG
ncbi:MAG: PGPGW domain-containing protein [Acidimicrobiia bacterium]